LALPLHENSKIPGVFAVRPPMQRSPVDVLRGWLVPPVLALEADLALPALFAEVDGPVPDSALEPPPQPARATTPAKIKGATMLALLGMNE